MPVDYQLAPWLAINPGLEYANTIQQSRQLDQSGQRQKFEQGIQTQEADRAKQTFEMQKQAAARKLAADSKFQAATAGLDQSDPQYRTKYLNAMLQHSAETGEFGQGMGAAINALKPAPSFQPMVPPATSTAPYAPITGGAMGAAMMPGTATGTPAPAAPSAAPSPWLHPPGTFGGKFIRGVPAPVPKPVAAPKPIVTRPGEVVLDPLTLKPSYTNTTQLPGRASMPIAPRVVPPGGVVYENGKPTYTNTTQRVTGKALEPLAMPQSKDDLKEREVYQTAHGPAWWDGEQFHLEK